MDSLLMRENNTANTPSTGNANWPELLAKTVGDLSAVARTEISLLEASLKRLVEAQTDKTVGMLILVVALSYGGLFVLGGVVLLIHVWLAWWLSFLITGIAISSAGVGFLMMMRAAAKAKERVSETWRIQRPGVPRKLTMDQAPQTNGRGRTAGSPREIPKTGWWSILKRVYASFGRKNISILAAGVAFYAMLSIFPALAALIAIYGLLADPATVQHEISAIHGIIPGEAQSLIETYLKSVVTASSSKLGIGLVVSVAIALWSARSGVVTLIQALNITYEEDEKRGFVRFELIALAVTVAAIVFAIIALTLIAVIPPVIKFLPLGENAKFAGYIIPWPILIVLVSFGLAAAYRFLPSREEPKWRWVSWGGAAATMVWIIASAGFSIYVSKFGNYDKSFGALGAVIVLLTWLYLSAYVVLAGACLDAEMERQTARDTTTGAERPMGQRGAKMADTVADDEPQPALPNS